MIGVDVPSGGFGVILADPPWTFSTRSAKGLGKSPQRHYDCMTLDAIKAMPVASLAARDSVCVMWATSPLFPQALQVLEAWGFAYKATGAWAKRSSTGQKWHFATGYLYRGAVELWIVGTKGAPRRTSRSIRNLIVAPVREHSRKPEQMRLDLEALFPGPYLEMFAREPAPGWTSWGDQVGRFPCRAEAA